MESKKCTKCSLIKTTENFSKRRNSKDGLQCYCKACRKALHNKNKLALPKTNLKLVGATDVNATLSQFKDREIFAYLKSKGWEGELSIRQTVNIGKI